LKELGPGLVLVHGDTTTTMATSLAAFYAGVSVGHVEAGLRTGNKRAPFPEEINRRVTGCVTDIHFAPTDQARQNLLKEGVPDDTIHITGNTVIDALLMVRKKLSAGNLGESIRQELGSRYPDLVNVLSYPSDPSCPSPNALRLILVTGHRRENFGEGFET